MSNKKIKFVVREHRRNDAVPCYLVLPHGCMEKRSGPSVWIEGEVGVEGEKGAAMRFGSQIDAHIEVRRAGITNYEVVPLSITQH